VPDSRIREGYLVLADISGYTAFLTGNELEHAHGIVQDLTRCVIEQFAAPWQLVKLEGDAAFLVGAAASFADGERVVEAVERCYCAFADLRDDMTRSTTCSCTACANIGTLDLKFVGHFGSYVTQRLANVDDVAGPDVILAHRLLKNRVREQTGFRAYALLTDGLLGRLSQVPVMAKHEETYEGLGTVVARVEDLGALRDERVRARRVVIEKRDADFSFSYVVPASQEVTWQYWTEAAKRLRWSAVGGTTERTGANALGRTGVGSSFHCAHGRGLSLSRYVDWRPFDYFSTEKSMEKFSLTTPPPMIDTCWFEAIAPQETRVTYRFRLKNRGIVARSQITLLTPILRRTFAGDRDRLIAAVLADAAADQEAETTMAAPLPGVVAH
jgi:Protein of unknown function (DUF2652)